MGNFTLLRVEDLTVAYGAAVVVDQVCMKVRPHEIVGVFGPNGAGKSSLLKATVGLVKPAGGRVLLGDRVVTAASAEQHARQGMILVPEGRGNFPPLTVAENLRLGAYPSRATSRSQLDDRLSEVFDLFPILADRRGQRAGTLSGGEAAMLAVARGLMSRPRVLLLDEPTLGLAPTITARVYERLARLKDTDVGVVVVEQKAAKLLEVVDRTLVMRQGRSEHWAEGSIDLDELDRMYFGASA